NGAISVTQHETTQQHNGAISVTQHETTQQHNGAISVTQHETTQQQHGAISVTQHETTQQHNGAISVTQQHNALEVTLNVQNNTVQPSNNIEQQHTTTQPSLSHTQKMMIGLLLCTSLSNMALTVASFQFILGNVFAGWGTGSVLALMPAALCFYRFQHPHGYYDGFDNSKLLLSLCFFAEVIAIALHTFTSIDPSTTNAVATLTYGYVGKTGFVWAIASVLPSINIFTAGVFIGTCNNQE
ncbi:MAG: hypothetical protein IT273_14540, partial [Chitinophagales bacterium]|nr:hypothetical protein [Chitinophagales bacterium]